MEHETINMEESVDEMIPEICVSCDTQCVLPVCTSSDMYNNCGGFIS